MAIKSDGFTNKEVKELRLIGLNPADIEDKVSEITIFALEALKENPNNKNARWMIDSREAELQARYGQKR